MLVGLTEAAREGQLSTAIAYAPSKVTGLSLRSTVLPEQGNGSSPPSGDGLQRDNERLPHQQWQGKSTQFMRSNEHSRERAGVWNTQGLEGPALALVEGDEQSGRCITER